MASPFEELLKQLTNPWDWVAAGVGAGGGAAVTVLSHGADLGQSIGAGALAAVTARKAAAASMAGRDLRKRAEGLEKVIDAHLTRNPKGLSDLRDELNRERNLWRSKAISDDQFKVVLDGLVTKFRTSFRGGDA